MHTIPTGFGCSGIAATKAVKTQFLMMFSKKIGYIEGLHRAIACGKILLTGGSPYLFNVTMSPTLS